jgi:hypothetical protein
MLDLFWDLFQQGQINNLHGGRLSQLEKEKSQDNKADSLEARLQELEQRHEQLKLVTLAFWSLLRDHAGLLESDLRKYVEKIDLLDGKQDGKVTKTIGKGHLYGLRSFAARNLCRVCLLWHATQARRPLHRSLASARDRKPRPNPSLERTSTGLALGPRGYSGHHPPRGPSTNPVASAQLKR